MNIFKNIFRSKKSNPEVATTPVVETLAPTQELFVCDDPIAPLVSKPRSAVKSFLGETFYHNGRIAGFQQHCHDGLQIHLNHLRAAFRNAVDEDIDKLSAKLEKLEESIIDVGNSLPSMQQKLQLKLKNEKQKVLDLQDQKALSIDSEGLVSPAVYEFSRGYKQGMLDYFEQQNLFGININS